MRTNDLMALLASDSLQLQKPMRPQLTQAPLIATLVCGLLGVLPMLGALLWALRQLAA